MAELVTISKSILIQTVGIGRRHRQTVDQPDRPTNRFPGAAPLASSPVPATRDTGVAPIEVASADKARHRLSRSGDRRLNSALHIIAFTQIRGHRLPEQHLIGVVVRASPVASANRGASFRSPAARNR